MLSISETKRAAAASAAARSSRGVVKRFWLFRSSEDSFFQVVSLYVVGKDLYELHSRRAIVQLVSCNLYQSGRIVFPCNVRQLQKSPSQPHLHAVLAPTTLERRRISRFSRSSVVGIFPSADACTRLVTTYLMEYAEDWSASRAYLSEQSVQAILQPAA